jgi:hypothetical protein
MSADPVQAAIQAVLNDLEALKTSKDEAVPWDDLGRASKCFEPQFLIISQWFQMFQMPFPNFFMAKTRANHWQSSFANFCTDLHYPSLSPYPSFGFGCFQLGWHAARQTWQLVVQAQLVCDH